MLGGVGRTEERKKGRTGCRGGGGGGGGVKLNESQKQNESERQTIPGSR